MAEKGNVHVKSCFPKQQVSVWSSQPIRCQKKVIPWKGTITIAHWTKVHPVQWKSWCPFSWSFLIEKMTSFSCKTFFCICNCICITFPSGRHFCHLAMCNVESWCKLKDYSFWFCLKNFPAKPNLIPYLKTHLKILSPGWEANFETLNQVWNPNSDTWPLLSISNS